jgi:aspartate 1-decarboxylase
MLRAKVHRIAVTERNVEYEGSLTLDTELMRAADLRPFERIEVYDIANGARFATYVIEGPPRSGTCCVNGAAARLVETGDRLILAAYADVAEDELQGWQPTLVVVDEHNRVREIKRAEGHGVRVPSTPLSRTRA